MWKKQGKHYSWMKIGKSKPQCWGRRDRWLSYDGVEDFLNNSKHKLIELPMVETLLFSGKSQNSFLLGEEAAAAYFLPFTFASTILIYNAYSSIIIDIKCLLCHLFFSFLFFSWTSNLQFVVLSKIRETWLIMCPDKALKLCFCH